MLPKLISPVTRKKFTLESIFALVFKNQVRLEIGLLLYKEGINFSKEGLSLLENPVFHKAKPICEYSTSVNFFSLMTFKIVSMQWVMCRRF